MKNRCRICEITRAGTEANSKQFCRNTAIQRAQESPLHQLMMRNVSWKGRGSGVLQRQLNKRGMESLMEAMRKDGDGPYFRGSRAGWSFEVSCFQNTKELYVWWWLCVCRGVGGWEVFLTMRLSRNTHLR